MQHYHLAMHLAMSVRHIKDYEETLTVLKLTASDYEAKQLST